MPNDDATDVTAARAGDRAAFTRLYDRYAGLVRAVGFEATGTVSDAQDLAQEVFLDAWEKLSNLRDPERFGAWIVSIARSAGKQWRRTKRRDRHRFSGETAGFSGEEAAFDDAGEFRELHTALLSLDETERTAIHLFYLQGRSADQARDELCLSLSGLYRVLTRARAKLRDHLSRNARKGIRP